MAAVAKRKGFLEGATEGCPEGATYGCLEGGTEGCPEGATEGCLEGAIEGAGRAANPLFASSSARGSCAPTTKRGLGRSGAPIPSGRKTGGEGCPLRNLHTRAGYVARGRAYGQEPPGERGQCRGLGQAGVEQERFGLPRHWQSLLSHTVLFALFGDFRARLVEGLDRVYLARYIAHSAQLFALFQMRLLA